MEKRRVIWRIEDPQLLLMYRDLAAEDLNISTTPSTASGYDCLLYDEGAFPQKLCRGKVKVFIIDGLQYTEVFSYKDFINEVNEILSKDRRSGDIKNVL